MATAAAATRIVLRKPHSAPQAAGRDLSDATRSLRPDFMFSYPVGVEHVSYG